MALTSYNATVAKAITTFQEKYASTILEPNGMTSGNGYFGVSTRTKMNSLYGCTATASTGTTASGATTGSTQCPTGYTCTPKSQVTTFVCPTGYTCTLATATPTPSPTPTATPDNSALLSQTASQLNCGSSAYSDYLGTADCTTSGASPSPISTPTPTPPATVNTTVATTPTTPSAAPVPTAAQTAAIIAQIDASDVNTPAVQYQNIAKDLNLLFYPPSGAIQNSNSMANFASSYSDPDWVNVTKGEGFPVPSTYCHRAIPNDFAIALYNSFSKLGIDASYLVNDSTRYVIPGPDTGALAKRIFVKQNINPDYPVFSYYPPTFARCLDAGFVSNYPTYIANYTAYVNSHVSPPKHIFTFGETIGVGGVVAPAPTITPYSSMTYTLPTIPTPTAASTAAVIAKIDASDVNTSGVQYQNVGNDLNALFYPPSTTINYQSNSDQEWASARTNGEGASRFPNPDSYCHRPVSNGFAIVLNRTLQQLGINSSYLVSDSTKYAIPNSYDTGALAKRIFVKQNINPDYPLFSYYPPTFARCLDAGFVSNYPTYITNYTAYVNSHVSPPKHIFTFGEYIGTGGVIAPAPTI